MGILAELARRFPDPRAQQFVTHSAEAIGWRSEEQMTDLVGGYGLYLRGGKPTFVYNYLALDRTTVSANEQLPAGKVQLKVDFAYQGGPSSLLNIVGF